MNLYGAGDLADGGARTEVLGTANHGIGADADPRIAIAGVAELSDGLHLHVQHRVGADVIGLDPEPAKRGFRGRSHLAEHDLDLLERPRRVRKLGERDLARRPIARLGESKRPETKHP